MCKECQSCAALTHVKIDDMKEGMRMKKEKKGRNVVGLIGLGIVAVLVLLVIIFLIIYASRLKTIASIEQISDYDEGINLYCMDIKYDYSLDDIIARGITDDQSMIDALLAEALPLLPVHVQAPNFGCSAFTLDSVDGETLMGRNYDFRNDSSAMLVYCTPSDGYKSVAFAALDNLGANVADADIKSKLTCLAAPFVCLDGMNEKGVSIAVLTLDSEPTRQDRGNPDISTSLAIRLVLDRAASTAEAVELLNQYDMIATAGRDYHFYITDASGDGRIVEYDCESETRELVATPTRSVTNFFILYKDKVTNTEGKNGIYGHGRDRYDTLEAIFDEEEGSQNKDTAWRALQAASQVPKGEDITSNTQWSIVFNNTDLTLEFVLHRNWNDVFRYDLKTNTLELPVN